MSDKIRKRELLPTYRKIIEMFVEGSKDVAVLELENNVAAIRRARAHMRTIQKEIDDFYGKLEDIRTEATK